MDGNVVLGNNKDMPILEQPVFYNDLTYGNTGLLLAYNINQVVFQSEAADCSGFSFDGGGIIYPAHFLKMQQKVMLVICFLLKADIYIVDEPFMGLDPRAIRDFLILLQQERSRGAGVLMSTHALDTAEKVCDSIILMSEGRLIVKGSLDEIRKTCGLREGSLLDCFNKLLEDSP